MMPDRQLRKSMLSMLPIPSVLLALNLTCWVGNAFADTPRTLQDASGAAVEVVASGSAACALLMSREVQCWGDDSYGELGRGNGNVGSSATPEYVVGLDGAVHLNHVRSLVAGSTFFCARLFSNEVACWGDDSSGQLGDGRTAVRQPAPVTVLAPAGGAPLRGVSELAAGDGWTCALLFGGILECWGTNSVGELGNREPESAYSELPVHVAAQASLQHARTVGGGGQVPCAVAGDGTVYCWGYGLVGQLGPAWPNSLHGPTKPFDSADRPFGPLEGLNGAQMVVGGADHDCALMIEGTVRCWGGGATGTLGDGTQSSSKLPVLVRGLRNVRALAAGGFTSCAIVGISRSLECWGDNLFGALGQGPVQGFVAVPRPVDSVVGRVQSVGVGLYFACAVADTGRVWCWGEGNLGQLGDGGLGNSGVPVQVS